jgi:putative transposase
LPHTYFQNVMHVVFSTKERRKIIPPEMKERLWSYTAGICKRQNVFVHGIGGVEDHIHLLLQFPATIAIAEAVKKIKANSSGWMSDEIGKLFLAGRIRSFQRKQIKHVRRATVRSESGKAPSQNDV